MATDQEPDSAEPSVRDGERTLSWEVLTVLLQALGAAAALVAWLVLVGGIHARERLEAGGVPNPTRAVTLLPRNELVAEGILVLAVPLALAALLGLSAYLLSALAATARWRPVVGPMALGLLAGAAMAYALIDQVPGDRWVRGVAIGAATTAVLALVGALALVRWNGSLGVALTVAVLILVWGGAFELLTERVSNPRFEPTQVIRKDRSGTRGLLLSRADDVTLICVGDRWRSLLTVPGDDVRQVSFQDAVPIQEYARQERQPGEGDCRRLPAAQLYPPRRPPPGTTTTATPPPDPTPTTATPPPDPTPTTATPPPDPTPTTATPPSGPAGGPAIPLRRVRTLEVGRHRTFLYRLGTFSKPVTGVVSFVTADEYRLRPGVVRRVWVSTHAFDARANGPAAVRGALSRSAWRLLQRERHLPVVATVTARDTRGRATVTSHRFALEKP